MGPTMTVQERVRVPSPDLLEIESAQVLSEDRGTIGAILTRTELNRRQSLEKAISAFIAAFPCETTRCVPQRGDYVLAYSELSAPRWCRALVLDVSFSLVRVDLLDYGYTEEVRCSDIMQLPPSLATHPAYSVRLQVDVTQVCVSNTYSFRLGNYVDDLQRTIEAVPVVAHLSGYENHVENESKPVVIPEDVGSEETGVVRGFTTTYGDSALVLYGVQHRDGFEVIADQLAHSELRSKSQVNKGDFVVVPYDSFWCRALVTDIGTESARVYHVDFGSWDTVSLSNLFCLPTGSTAETPQLSFQCITEDGTILKENEEYKFVLNSIFKDYGYPVRVCKASPPGADLPLVYKVSDLPTHDVNAVKTVQLVEKHQLNGGFYGVVVPEGDTALCAIEQQLDECFSGPSVDFLSEPRVGDLVISYIDGKFYRSVICEISDAEICVFQIDVGSFSCCSNSVIITLPEKLLAYPSVALLCLLDDNQNAMELMSTFRVRNFAKHSTVYGIDVFTFETVADHDEVSYDPAQLGAGIEDVSTQLGAGIEEASTQIGAGIEEVSTQIGAGIEEASTRFGAGIEEASTRVEAGVEQFVSQDFGYAVEEVQYYTELEHDCWVRFAAPTINDAVQPYYTDQEHVPSASSGVGTQDLSHSTFSDARSRATTPTQRIVEPRKLHHHSFPVSSLDDINSNFLDVKIISASPTEDGLVSLSVILIDRQGLIEEALSFIEPDTLKPLYLSDLRDGCPGVMKSGDSWVRVVVEERPGPNSCVVQLVDYGARMSCNVGELFCCPPEYVPIEICALDCLVAKTSPDNAAIEALLGQIVVLKHSDSKTCTVYSRETGEAITL